MIDIMNGNAVMHAWRLLWKRKILWLYVPFFYFFDYLVPGFYVGHVPETTKYVTKLFLAIALSIVLVLLVATFYKNALSWFDDQRSSFFDSFKLGRKVIMLVFWGVILGIISALQYDLPLFFKHVNDQTVMWLFILFLVIKLLFLACTAYVTIILVSSPASLWSATKRSLLLVRRTWLSLLGVIFELFVYLLILGVVIVVLNFIWFVFSGSSWMFADLLKSGIAKLWFYQIIISPCLWIIIGLLFYGALTVLYRRQLISEQQDVLSQIPPYVL